MYNFTNKTTYTLSEEDKSDILKQLSTEFDVVITKEQMDTTSSFEKIVENCKDPNSVEQLGKLQQSINNLYQYVKIPPSF